jgi:hypothetical protein
MDPTVQLLINWQTQIRLNYFHLQLNHISSKLAYLLEKQSLSSASQHQDLLNVPARLESLPPAAEATPSRTASSDLSIPAFEPSTSTAPSRTLLPKSKTTLEGVTKRRTRQVKPPHQANRLKTAFEENQWPNKTRIDELAQELSLSRREVGQWFSRKRHQMKDELRSSSLHNTCSTQ